MINLFLYCRAGYEKDCAAEIQERAAELNIGGFVKTNRNDGYVIFQCFQAGDADLLAEQLELDSLIFTRQMFAANELLKDLPEGDRVTPIVEALAKVNKAGELRVETPDTNEAKELSTFCRKFTVPLRQALKRSGYPKVYPAKENLLPFRGGRRMKAAEWIPTKSKNRAFDDNGKV